MPKIGLVVTTINKGAFLKAYCYKVRHENADVTFYVIPDTKSPRELHDACNTESRLGSNVRYMSMYDQDQYLKKLNFNLVPYNSDNRRNIGYLKAYEDGCDIIISIDDDNLCIADHYFGVKGHGVVGEVVTLPTCSDTKWHNVCQHLGMPTTYPRGFPYRYRKNLLTTFKTGTGKVAVNAGLWFGDPDLDAITWLHGRMHTSGGNIKSIFLGDAWSPINSQNTAVSRDALPAYYFIPMGNTVNGLTIDRYGDIFQGYFLEACVKDVGDSIRFGTPVVDHVRNSHNYMEDASKELGCIQLMDEFLDWLTEVKIGDSNYRGAYVQLSYLMEDACEKFTGKLWTIDAKSFIHRTAYCMRRWIKTIEQIG